MLCRSEVSSCAVPLLMRAVNIVSAGTAGALGPSGVEWSGAHSKSFHFNVRKKDMEY